MTQKSKNILLLFLSVLFACFFIPWGIRNDWPLWLYFVALPVLSGGLCISWWGTDYGFSPVPLEKMSRKEKSAHFCSWMFMLTGFYFIEGMFGNAWWLVMTGCTLIIAGSFVQRYLAQKYGK